MSQAFRFLDLAPELREKIYTLLCSTTTPYIQLNAPHAHASFPLNLHLTNAQIYHELRPLYFTSNAFSITLLRRNEVWDYFLSPAWQDNRRQIHSLRLNIVRWGTKEFFAQRLLPVLEDCILNGRLRDLEVRMREGWVRESDKLENVSVGENSNWGALLRLLEDPYLERKLLMAGPAWPDEDVWDAKGLDGREPFRHVEWVFDLRERVWRNISQEEREAMRGR
jgi:hypothetical protein